MATLSCKRYGIGPYGTDKRLETAKAQQDDCLKQAKLACQGYIYACISDAFGRFTRIEVDCFDAKGPGCLGDLTCYNDQCLYAIEKCYCISGRCGLMCTVCEPEVEPPDPFEPPDDPEENINESKLSPLSTQSCYDCPIPVVFGKVILTGNIIWIGGQYKAQVEIRETIGNVTNIERTEVGFVHLALGLCEGEIEAISRVWINDTLVVNDGVTLGDEDETSFNRFYYDLGLNMELMQGRETQKINPLAMFIDGEFGITPAYRGLAHVVFKNFPIFVSSSSMPSFKIEVIVRVDHDAVNHETLAIGDIIPDYMDVDDMSERAIVSNGDVLKVVNIGTMAIEAEIDADDPIINARFSPEGDILFQGASEDMTLIRGFDYNERVVLNVPAYDFGAPLRVNDELNNRVISVVTTLTGTQLDLYSMDRGFVQPELVNEASYPLAIDTGVFTHMFMNDFAARSDVTPNFKVFALAKEVANNDITLVRYGIANMASMQPFDPTLEEPLQFGLSANMFGLGAGINISAAGFLTDDKDGNVIIWATDGGNLKSAMKFSTFFFTPMWASAAEPPNNACFNPMRRNQSHSYSYISGDAVYTMDITLGNVAQTATLSAGGAPAYAGAQYFDGSRNIIFYVDENGDVTKFFARRFVSIDPSVADILRRVWHNAGLDPHFLDVSDVENVTIEGYIVAEQDTAINVISELIKFFHLSVSDASGKLTFRRLETATSISLEENFIKLLVDTRSRHEADELKSASISYYDADRDGEKQTQSVNRDVFTDDRDFVANLEDESYSIPIFTTGKRVRQSAEVYLLKQSQNQDKRGLFLAPRHIAVEPSDFVGAAYRTHRIEIDASLMIRVEAQNDSINNYTLLDVLEAPELDFLDRVKRDFDRGVANYPIGFMLPPIIENPDSNYVYTGLVNPNVSTFFPTEIFIRAQSSNPSSAGTPTAEAVFGRLVTAPDDDLTAEFTSDKTGTMQIKFNKAIPAGALENLASYLPMYETYNENLLFVGREMIKYNSYSIGFDSRTVTFTGLQRGRWGTDEHMRDHFIGEPCMVYIPTTRVMSSRIPFEAMNGRMIQAITYDPRNTRIFKHEDMATFDYLNRKWRMARGVIRKSPGLGVEIVGVPRVPFQQGFGDDGLATPESFLLQSIFNYDLNAYLLRAPFDIDEWNDNFEYPETFDESIDWSSNPYIMRSFLVERDVSDPFPTAYTEAQMATDGVTYADDLHLVFFVTDVGNVVSDLRAWRFEGNAIYNKFKPGLWAY